MFCFLFFFLPNLKLNYVSSFENRWAFVFVGHREDKRISTVVNRFLAGPVPIPAMFDWLCQPYDLVELLGMMAVFILT